MTTITASLGNEGKQPPEGDTVSDDLDIERKAACLAVDLCSCGVCALTRSEFAQESERAGVPRRTLGTYLRDVGIRVTPDEP